MDTTDYNMSFELVSNGLNFDDCSLFGICNYVYPNYRIDSIHYIKDNSYKKNLNEMLKSGVNIIPVFTKGDLMIILMGLLKDDEELFIKTMKGVSSCSKDSLVVFLFNEVRKHLFIKSNRR